MKEVLHRAAKNACAALHLLHGLHLPWETGGKKHGSAERTGRPNHNTDLGRARIPFGCSGKQGRKGHFSVV